MHSLEIVVVSVSCITSLTISKFYHCAKTRFWTRAMTISMQSQTWFIKATKYKEMEKNNRESAYLHLLDIVCWEYSCIFSYLSCPPITAAVSFSNQDDVTLLEGQITRLSGGVSVDGHKVFTTSTSCYSWWWKRKETELQITHTLQL